MNGNRYYGVRVEGAKYGVGFGSALAIAISYTNNHSILWAIIHGILGWLYVIYAALFRVIAASKCLGLRRIAVARQDLRRPADAAPEGFVKRRSADVPLVRTAMPVQPPPGGPSEFGIVPDQPSDQGHFTTQLGHH
jgi:hypothetical protein